MSLLGKLLLAAHVVASVVLTAMLLGPSLHAMDAGTVIRLLATAPLMLGIILWTHGTMVMRAGGPARTK